MQNSPHAKFTLKLILHATIHEEIVQNSPYLLGCELVWPAVYYFVLDIFVLFFSCCSCYFMYTQTFVPILHQLLVIKITWFNYIDFLLCHIYFFCSFVDNISIINGVDFSSDIHHIPVGIDPIPSNYD